MEIAIGLRNWACLLFSNINGASPAMVVKEVKNIALNLDFPLHKGLLQISFPAKGNY
jgi:hypothetical protein